MLRRYVCILLVMLAVVILPAIGPAQDLMSVQVKNAQLRATPSFLGKIVSTVVYAQQVTILQEQGAWVNVAVTGTGSEGWMHSTALTKKKILLNPSASDISQAASSDEIALAGKGFNAQVEEEFKARNSQVNYTPINDMETIVISHTQMRQFLQQGEVTPEGGQQ